MLDTFLSIFGVGANVFSIASGIKTGKSVEETLRELKKTNQIVKKIDENLFYAPKLKIVERIDRSITDVKNDIIRIKQILKPIQKTINDKIISSTAIDVPNKTLEILKKHASKILINVKPISEIIKPNDPEMVPILFDISNSYYVGWQKSAIIPTILGIQYNHSNKIWQISHKQIPKLLCETPFMDIRIRRFYNRIEAPKSGYLSWMINKKDIDFHYNVSSFRDFNKEDLLAYLYDDNLKKIGIKVPGDIKAIKFYYNDGEYVNQGDTLVEYIFRDLWDIYIKVFKLELEKNSFLSKKRGSSPNVVKEHFIKPPHKLNQKLPLVPYMDN